MLVFIIRFYGCFFSKSEERDTFIGLTRRIDYVFDVFNVYGFIYI